MCYYISVSPRIKDLEIRFGVKFLAPEQYKPVYSTSAFTLPYIPVISNENPSEIDFYQWGLVPFWVKDDGTANKIRIGTLNARSETIFGKRSFKHAILSKRCLVISDGFYEWRHEGKKRYPYHIFLADGKPFALAGIWDSWTNENTGETNKTFSIITTRANSLLEVIHNTRKRMPVILRKEEERLWLKPDIVKEQIESLLAPYDTEKMKAHTVSRVISKRGFNTNDKSVLDVYEYAELKS